MPLQVSIPKAPAQIGCLGLTLAAGGAPDEAEPVVQAAGALLNQIFKPVLGSAGCDISEYEQPGGKPYYYTSNEDGAGGSGSGITHFGEFDSQSAKPAGLSSGEPTRRKRETFKA